MKWFVSSRYAVVDFPKDNSCAIVSTKWIKVTSEMDQDNMTCFYPSQKWLSNANTWAKNEKKVENVKFNSYDAVLVYLSGKQSLETVKQP